MFVRFSYILRCIEIEHLNTNDAEGDLNYKNIH